MAHEAVVVDRDICIKAEKEVGLLKRGCRCLQPLFNGNFVRF